MKMFIYGISQKGSFLSYVQKHDTNRTICGYGKALFYSFCHISLHLKRNTVLCYQLGGMFLAKKCATLNMNVDQEIVN